MPPVTKLQIRDSASGDATRFAISVRPEDAGAASASAAWWTVQESAARAAAAIRRAGARGDIVIETGTGPRGQAIAHLHFVHGGDRAARARARRAVERALRIRRRRRA